MTCAACATRIERKLNKLDGVDASVNYATEQASVSYDPELAAVADLVRAIEAAGYGASLEARAGADEERARALRLRLVVAAVLTAPLALLAMLPPLQFAGWEWLALALATPVVLWAGLAVPPRGGAQRAPRRGDHGHAHLDRHARGVGLVGRRARRARGRAHVLRGRGRDHDADPARPLLRGAREAALERGAPLAARARREGGARAPRRRRGRGAASTSSRSATSSSCARARRSRPTASWSRRLVRGRPVDADRRAGAGRGRPGRRGRGRDDQRLRSAARARDARRRRDRARADRAPGRGGAGGQGADPAARRPRSRRSSSRSCS